MHINVDFATILCILGLPVGTDLHLRWSAAGSVPDGEVQIVTADADLSGRVAVVTGAARGIGAALALKLAASGARVALVGLEPDELSTQAERCARLSPARAWTADVTDVRRMNEVSAEVAAHFGGVDVVVANAGILSGGLFVDSDAAEFARVIEVNLIGSSVTARAFLPQLIQSGGYFLQIASLAAITPAPTLAAYCASKSGIESFAYALRAEVAHQGVQVGVAYASFIDTDMVQGFDADELLQELRAGYPWPMNKIWPVDPAVRRLARGISRRSPKIYVHAWIRGSDWLPRAMGLAVAGRFGARSVAGLADRLGATAGQRALPFGPGGLAGSAASAAQARSAALSEHAVTTSVPPAVGAPDTAPG